MNGILGPWRKGIKRSTLGIRRSKVEVTRGFGDLANVSFSIPLVQVAFLVSVKPTTARQIHLIYLVISSAYIQLPLC